MPSAVGVTAYHTVIGRKLPQICGSLSSVVAWLMSAESLNGSDEIMAALSKLSFPGGAARATPGSATAATGDWEMHVNGGQGTLRIRRIDELGRISGSVFGKPITGWWSERARRLVFSQNGEEADPSDDRAYEGYAWDEPSACCSLVVLARR